MQYEAEAIEANVLVWDLKTMPDRRGFAAKVTVRSRHEIFLISMSIMKTALRTRCSARLGASRAAI